jgi:hypothetical protein
LLKLSDTLAVGEDLYGMRVISETRLRPITLLRYNKSYQRPTSKKRLKQITDSIVKYRRYWPSSVIIVNELLEVLDGQHRTKAAIALGFTQLPVCVVTFNSKADEARYFVDCNSGPSTTLNTVDFWHARSEACHPIADLLYYMECEPVSKLKNKIVIKGKASPAIKWTIPSVVEVMATAAGMENPRWTARDDNAITEAISAMDEQDVVDYVNDFVTWIEKCYKTKADGSMAYHNKAFGPLLRFYSILEKKGLAFHKDTIRKMQSFTFSADVLKMHREQVLIMLVANYNHRRTTNRLELGV